MKVWDLDETIGPEEAESFWAGMDQGDQAKLSGRYRRRDGSTFPVEVHIRRHDIDGEKRFVVISRDVTEQRQREQQLEQFASVVSHDLRNPLGVAAGNLQLARETGESEHFDAVERAHDRMDALIDDLLTLAREGERVSDIDEVDLASVAEDSWRTVETAEAALSTTTDSRIHADRERLKQLLENLVRNAIEHGGDDVTVTVGDLPDGFYVADDGPGVPADDRDRVFEAGYSSTDRGIGFGLSIAQQIVEAHGWEITLAASDDGGARFEITGVETDG
jgi:signal transduction histidine kinase